MEELVLCPDCSAAIRLGVFLSIAQFDKMDSRLAGTGLESQFPLSSLSPITFMVWEQVSPQKSWDLGLGLLLPRNPLRLPFVISLRCETVSTVVWTMALEPGRIQLPGISPPQHDLQATPAPCLDHGKCSPVSRALQQLPLPGNLSPGLPLLSFPISGPVSPQGLS